MILALTTILYGILQWFNNAVHPNKDNTVNLENKMKLCQIILKSNQTYKSKFQSANNLSTCNNNINRSPLDTVHKNLSNTQLHDIKPPNILIYSGKKDSRQIFEKIKKHVSNCVNLEKYTIYHLLHERVYKDPWRQNVSLLMIASEKVYDMVGDVFLEYFLSGGKIVSFGSNFDDFLVKKDVKTKSMICNISYEGQNGVPVLAGKMLYNSSTIVKDLEVTTLATEVVSKLPIIVSVSNDKGGKAILSQAHLEKPYNDFAISPEIFKEFQKSEDIRFKILKNIFEKLGIDSEHTEAPECTPLHILSVNEKLKETLIDQIKRRLVNNVLHSSVFPLKFHPNSLRTPNTPLFNTNMYNAIDNNTPNMPLFNTNMYNAIDTNTPNMPLLNTNIYNTIHTNTPIMPLFNNNMCNTIDTNTPNMYNPINSNTPLQCAFLNYANKKLHDDAYIVVAYTNDKPSFDMCAYSANLSTRVLGNVVFYADIISSTMDVLDSLMFSCPQEVGLIATAKYQTKGKGRSSNQWLSPVGCAMFTCHLRVPIESALGKNISCAQHLVAVSAIQAGRSKPKLKNFDMRIKWPNDIYYKRNVKLGGILVKTTTFQNVYHMLIGFGVNVSNSKPTTCINDLILTHLSQQNPSPTSVPKEGERGHLGDELLVGCHGDELLVGCRDDKLYFRCRDDELSISCHGDELSVGCHGDELLVGYCGDNLSVGCHGDDLSVGCHGDNLAVGCHSDELSVGCHSDDMFTVEEYIGKMISCLEKLVDDYQTNGPDKFLSLYREFWLHDNEIVTYQDGDVFHSGQILGIDEFGYLLVKRGDTVKRVEPDNNSFDMMKNLISTKVAN